MASRWKKPSINIFAVGVIVLGVGLVVELDQCNICLKETTDSRCMHVSQMTLTLVDLSPAS